MVHLTTAEKIVPEKIQTNQHNSSTYKFNHATLYVSWKHQIIN